MTESPSSASNDGAPSHSRQVRTLRGRGLLRRLGVFEIARAAVAGRHEVDLEIEAAHDGHARARPDLDDGDAVRLERAAMVRCREK